MNKEKNGRFCKVDWIIHLVANGVSCEDCGKTESGFLPYMCNAHTHGMYKYGHQEFQFVLNIGQSMIKYILNSLGLRVQRGEKFKSGDSVPEIIQNYDIRLKEAEVDGEMLLRVLIPDANGRFPGDAGCQEPYSQQLLPMSVIYHNGGIN